jgi:hypothetical protein
MNQAMEPRWIALSGHVYGALLNLYPVVYRREYGWLMRQVFRDVSRDRYYSHGLVVIALWWCRTLFDLTLTVLEERRKAEFVFSKSTIAQLTGILLVLGGAFGALAAFSQLQPDDHYTYYGVYQLLIWLLAPSYLLIGLGCIGLALRYDEALGSLRRWTLYLTAVGSWVMAVGIVATSMNDDWWELWLAGGVMHLAGLAAFGLLHLQKPTLPIFRALPLMIAGGWLAMMLGILRTTSQTSNNALAFLIVVGTGLAWLAIGQAVNRQQRNAALATAQSVMN